MISFDDAPPTKPKPQLKARRPSSASKKMSSGSLGDGVGGGGGPAEHYGSSRKENVPPEVMICIVSSNPVLNSECDSFYKLDPRGKSMKPKLNCDPDKKLVLPTNLTDTKSILCTYHKVKSCS